MENIAFTNSQKKTFDFYTNHSNKFDNTISVTQNSEKSIVVETAKEIFYIGKLGGLTSEFKKI